MSFPNIPDVNPNIDISRDEVINLLLASIAFEELGLAHIINSEAEKIQYVLGTLNVPTVLPPPTIDELLEINTSVNHTMRTIIKSQMLLQFKLEDVIKTPNIIIHKNVATATGTFDGVIYSDSDPGYYFTIVNNNNGLL